MSARHEDRASHGRPAGAGGDGELWFYGHHAVAAALDNPLRPCRRLLCTTAALARLGRLVQRPGLAVEEVRPADLARVLPADAVHQGVALLVGPLPRRPLDSLLAGLGTEALVLLLDQIQDPRNLGAILRTAAALDVAGVVVPERRSAPLGGACAKAASGALDMVPIVQVANLGQAIEALQGAGFWVVGLDAAAEPPLESLPYRPRRALVLGSEEKGLRRLVAERCDLSARLVIAPRIESLNVSVAAGIALYLLARGLPRT
ncbi:MAG: 23S rRNA (guanosine(2251)-2'-O)-methyltransferase RlmB [Geminicoccaceae bacterium]|nr:23S rRNA (guanosine(2251)-2'-O)-methyltransferase RlmB [Geminicoccaceae bacterium]MDW8371984.1 23S rRNA (guanosine(2251)-2'-O)-methyltransferase RlmB [Geminicoccaceae bacterium]